MAKITIDKDRCKGCGLCINFCPQKVIKKSGRLNKLGLNYVEFSRQASLNKGGIPPPDRTGSRLCREKAGEESAQCLACAICAIICPDCCIEVYK